MTLPYDWPRQAEASVAYSKTPTALFYESEGAPPKWGWPALLDGTSHDTLIRFKLHLAPHDKVDHSTLPSIQGRDPVQTIADYLRCMKEHILTSLQPGTRVDVKEIKFCLTVPAIWGNAAIEDMRKAAEIAGLIAGPHGIINEGSAHPLVIVPEPEAAALYALENLTVPLPVGQAYMLIDIGGGTTDIAIHLEEPESVPHNRRLREVAPPYGAIVGGNDVDVAFFQLLASRNPNFEAARMRDKKLMLKLRASWEAIKHTFTGLEPSIAVELRGAFRYGGKDFEEFTAAQIKEVFRPTLEKICATVIRAQALCTDTVINAGILVGGFTDNTFVREYLRVHLVQS